MANIREGQFDDAAGHFKDAIAADPTYAEAHNNFGAACVELRRYADAVAAFQRAIQIDPEYGQAHFNLGFALSRVDKWNEALDSFLKAIHCDPLDAEPYYHLGTAQLRVGNLLDSLASFVRATELRPDDARTYNAIGAVLVQMGRGSDAIPAFDQALAIDPDQPLARAQRLFQLARLCDWNRMAGDLPLVPDLGIVGQPVPPFTLLAFEDAPQRHRMRSERYAAENFGTIIADSMFFPPNVRPDRIRLGYFSADFHDHATMYLASDLFERHDRDRYEVHFYSYGPASDGAMRQRLLACADSFDEIGGLGNAAAATLARAHRIDLAIDLKGFTANNRLGIFAHRAAPIQVSFLGFPGTSGAPFIDYLVTDPMVTPPDQRHAYAEKLIRLPHCYQPNDRYRLISEVPMNRVGHGLPPNGFVFCCFNNSYKVTPTEFDIWMRLLHRVDGSVLWLLAASDQVSSNLKSAAEARGIAADRLVFGSKLPLADHLARHRLADLFLDTFNCNAHTTASDALWAGLPVLTMLGQGFAARVAGSLLTAVGLDEMITDGAASYADLAFQLATNPERLGAIRAKLASNRLTMPLFDSALFTSHIEAGYQLAFQRFLEGQPPADIDVPAA